MKPLRSLGHAAVATGWRKSVADRLTPPLARHTPSGSERIRTAIGLGFLALTGKYVAETIQRFNHRTNGGRPAA